MNDIYVSYSTLFNEILGESIEDKLNEISLKLADEVFFENGEPSYSFNTIKEFILRWERM